MMRIRPVILAFCSKHFGKILKFLFFLERNFDLYLLGVTKSKNNECLHSYYGYPAFQTQYLKFWYVDGKIHRIDGPAVEHSDGSKYWFIDNKLHRLDDPAVELVDGSKYWYIYGINLTEEEFDFWSKDWNEETEIMFKLSFL